jgi:N-methylhydantoinase A
MDVGVAPMREHSETVEVGVDIGGTFTDVVINGIHGLFTLKLPTTKLDPSVAVLEAIRDLPQWADTKVHAIRRFLHGTTIATNAVLERKGGKTGLLTTAGFRDVLEIGRQKRRALYSVILEPETPVFLSPRYIRKEVKERISATGEVLIPLDENSVTDAITDLVGAGVESIAICYLYSFLNPKHELRTRELVAEMYPKITTSVSCEVDPQFREYERTVVTAFDAYVKPVVDQYLVNLESGLRKIGVTASIQVMQSRGGLADAAVARSRPVRLFLSGPAAGVVGGCRTGVLAGYEDLITVDIGGTSSDIALIHQGKPLLRSDSEIIGYPVRVSVVDVNTLGAGGGSIAWLDGAGSLRVGPHSAGADPGPACYGHGGDEATVTDASVVLGYLDPDYFAGGKVSLDPVKAFEVVKLRVAGPMGISVEEAALGIHRVVNAQMAEGMRYVSLRQGFDPRGFALVAFGGAGPLHACALARELGIRRIVIPRYPGVLAAMGLLVAPTEHECSSAFPRVLSSVSTQDVASVLERLSAECAKLMRVEDVDISKIDIRYYADVAYVGQSYHLEIPLHMDDPKPIDRLVHQFRADHDRVYGYSTDAPAAIVNLRCVHHVDGRNALPDTPASRTKRNTRDRQRPVRLDSASTFVNASIHDRDGLTTGALINGPAIVEQADTTTLIEPRWQATVDTKGNLVLEPST